ncbi:LamG domain-containing protein [Candidatus Pacearchaeota archaeon]|nr:LamG domain-containing protein [Candidatus Pacearchaeota archaeon]
MVHIKYTYKDGKKFGPYFYETKRVDGKIITTYLGTEFPNKPSSNMRFSLKGIIPLFVIIGILLFLFLPFNFTGNFSLDIKSSYELGEAIEGDLNFILNEGEIIPIDSKLLLNYGNYSKEVLLSSIISEEILSGEFYAEGVSLSGNGKGYGVIGTKTIYPEISFSLKISEDKSSDSDSSSDVSSIPDSTSSNELVKEESVKEEVAKEEETDKKENVKEIAKEEEISDEQEIESSAGITGSVISDSDNVFGVVSKENDFVYELSEDESADLIEGSVKYNGSILGNNVVKLKVNKNEIVASTDYSLELEGFGEDFAGNNQKKLKIDLNQFDFIANQNAVFSVSLVYGNVEIISVNETISVSNVTINNENTTAISNNLSAINQTVIANSTILNNITEINQTVIANFTISISLNDSALAVNLTQFSAVLGQPVKWVKRIAFNVNGSVELSVELPESAENITLNTLNLTEYLETETLTSEEITALTSVSPEIVLVNETIPVQEVIIGVTGNIITGQVSANIDLSKENWLKNLFGRLFGITGRVIETIPLAPNPQSVSVNLSDADFGVEVEYYTNAPIAIEFDEGTNKKIAISSPADVHYENVLIFTNLSDSFRITDLANVRIEWAENNSQNMEIYLANDSNKDGNYDYIEWIAPHLSNQTFNIIVIIDAQHLNETLGFISNIYNETKTLDNIWSETILANHYVRATFETNLTSINDITIYLRASNGTNISDVSINIYEKNSSEIIAQFNQLYEQKYNKVYLTNLSNRTQDTFDLLVLGGSVELDHIIDPNVGHNYSLVNPANGSSSTIRSVNLKITLDDQDNSGDGGQALVYVETNTTAFTNEHIVSVADSLSDPQTLEFNYSIPPLKYTANSGMFLLYHFDNNTQFGENRTLVNDFATGAFDGTITQAIRPMTSSVIGRGFDNVGGRIILTDAALLNSPSVTGEITIMFWVNMTTTHFPVAFPPIVGKEVNTNNRDYLIYFANSSKAWTLALGNKTTASATATTGFTTQNNTWYHLAFTFNKTTQNASIFVNGIVNRSATMALANALIDTTASLNILNTASANNLNNSVIDDLAIYNKTLTAQEILDVYRLTDKTYFWRVNSSDAVGLWNNSDTYQFSVDNIRPNVDLNDPTDGGSFLNTIPISFNWTATDFVDTSMNCNLTIDSVVNRTNVASANNTMVNVSVTGLSVANHLWNVTCIDDAGNSNTSSTITVRVTSANNAPYNGTVLSINSTSGTNFSNQDLNAYTSLLDLNNNSMNVTVRWYNSTNLHLTFEYNNSYVNGTTFIATLGKGNTTKGHNWTAGFTLNDGIDSFSVNSSNLTVKNTPPNVTLISPSNGSITLNRTTQNFIWAGSDDDLGDGITYDLNISLKAASTCADTVFNGNNLLSPDSSSYAISSSTPEQLNCFSDNNDYYKWSVRGIDSEGLIGSFTAPFNISLQALISASLNISVVSFGSIGYLSSNNTESNSPKPFILINNGNALTDVKLSATNLWQSVANPSSNYQAKIANVTTNGISENGSFIWASSVTSYTSLPLISSNFISSLNFTDVTDSAEIDINITVPSGEGPGLKTSTVTFTFTFAEVPG